MVLLNSAETGHLANFTDVLELACAIDLVDFLALVNQHPILESPKRLFGASIFVLADDSSLNGNSNESEDGEEEEGLDDGHFK